MSSSSNSHPLPYWPSSPVTSSSYSSSNAHEHNDSLTFSLDDIHRATMASTSTSTRALAPPPPRSRTASLSQSTSHSQPHLRNRTSANASASTSTSAKPPPTAVPGPKQVEPRPDSVLYSSPSWAQTMPMPKLHDPLPSALPARASVMAQLPPVMRHLGFLGKHPNGSGNRASLSSEDGDTDEAGAVFTLDDTPEFRSTISLMEPEGLFADADVAHADGDGEFAVLNLDGLDDMYDHDDAPVLDRSTGSSSDATLVHAATPPSLEPGASDHADGRYEGLSLAPMQTPSSDEQTSRGRRSTPKPSNPPHHDAAAPGNNRISVVGDLPTFPRKGSHHHTRAPLAVPVLSPTQESPPTPTRQQVHGNAAPGGTILGKLKRALSGRRTSPHSPSTARTGTPGSDDAATPPSPSTARHHRSNSIDQGIGTLRRALSRATSARRRKSPEDPPIPAPSSQAPNPYHNATAAQQQQQQQQQYHVSPYGTLLYNNNNNDPYQDYGHHPQQQFFSPPPESTLGGLAGGGDELFMATLARGDTESDRSVDASAQEVSTNPFATLAGLPLTVPTRTGASRRDSSSYFLGMSGGSGAAHAPPDVALSPPDLHEPVPAVFTLARPSAAAAAPVPAFAAPPPMTPTRVDEHPTGYVTLQHSGAPAVGPQATGDMLAQAREVAAYQTMRRGGR